MKYQMMKCDWCGIEMMASEAEGYWLTLSAQVTAPARSTDPVTATYDLCNKCGLSLKNGLNRTEQQR